MKQHRNAGGGAAGISAAIGSITSGRHQTGIEAVKELEQLLTH